MKQCDRVNISGHIVFLDRGPSPENAVATIVGLPSGSFSKGIKLATANLTGALSRIDSVLDAKPMSESSSSDHPADSTVDLSDVHFSYDGKTDVICGVSMEIAAGQTVAFVGPSGGGKSTLASLITRLSGIFA